MSGLVHPGNGSFILIHDHYWPWIFLASAPLLLLFLLLLNCSFIQTPALTPSLWPGSSVEKNYRISRKALVAVTFTVRSVASIGF